MSERGGLSKEIEVFEEGDHRGKMYTRRDLDDMVRNFEAGPKRHPLVIGHEEEQHLLKASDLPAGGWVATLRRRGPKLLARFSDVDPRVARVIRRRNYRTVSAEVYDEPPRGLPGKGKTLRRVALLGGDMPQLKTLADVPPDFAEEMSERFDASPVRMRCSAVRELPGGCFAVFSEVTPMDQQQMMDALAAHGVDVSALAGVPEVALAEMLRALDDAKASDLPEEGDDETMNKMMASDEMEEPADEERKGKYRECAKKYFERAGKHHARAKKHYEKYAAEDEAMGKKPMGEVPAEKMSELIRSAVDRAVKEATAKFERFSETKTASLKLSAVDAFLQAQLSAGRVLPRELDPEDESSLVNRLKRADARRVVTKFSEGGKEVPATELDLQMREIERRPVFAFSELVKASKEAPPGSLDREVEVLASKFSEQEVAFTRAGLTLATLTEGFKAERNTNPSLTAERFLSRA